MVFFPIKWHFFSFFCFPIARMAWVWLSASLPVLIPMIRQLDTRLQFSMSTWAKITTLKVCGKNIFPIFIADKYSRNKKFTFLSVQHHKNHIYYIHIHTTHTHIYIYISYASHPYNHIKSHSLEVIFFPFQRWKNVSNNILLLCHILTAHFICGIQSSHMLSTGVERREGVAANQFKNPPQFNLICKIKTILTISSILAWHFCFIATPYQWQAMLMSETVILDCLGFTVGEGNGNPLQYSCLENLMDGGAWWAAVYGVSQSWTRLKRLRSGSRLYCSREWKLIEITNSFKMLLGILYNYFHLSELFNY